MRLPQGKIVGRNNDLAQGRYLVSHGHHIQAVPAYTRARCSAFLTERHFKLRLHSLILSNEFVHGGLLLGKDTHRVLDLLCGLESLHEVEFRETSRFRRVLDKEGSSNDSLVHSAKERHRRQAESERRELHYGHEIIDGTNSHVEDDRVC